MKSGLARDENTDEPLGSILITHKADATATQDQMFAICMAKADPMETLLDCMDRKLVFATNAPHANTYAVSNGYLQSCVSKYCVSQ